MTKSEEYLEEYCRHFYGGAKTMNHKTLEDVEGLINEKIKEHSNIATKIPWVAERAEIIAVVLKQIKTDIKT